MHWRELKKPAGWIVWYTLHIFIYSNTPTFYLKWDIYINIFIIIYYTRWVLTCTNQLFPCFSPGYRQLAIGEQSTEFICCSCYFSSIYVFLEDIGANPQTRSKDFQPSSYDCEKDRITDMTRKLDRQFQSQNINNPYGQHVSVLMGRKICCPFNF